MSKSYGQYCPLALAVELLGERWTFLVVSRLLDGCRRFNEIHQGVPKLSASLLSTRLAQLEDAGLCKKQPCENGHGYEYIPTTACLELDPIVMDLAGWGQRWARDMETPDLDPAFLAWSMSTRLDIKIMPSRRTVIEFEFTGVDKEFERFWLVTYKGVVEMCLKHPGYDVDVKVMADLKLFIEAWRGLRSLKKEIAVGHIRVEGAPSNVKMLPKWLLGSALGNIERCRPGAEQKIYSVSR